MSEKMRARALLNEHYAHTFDYLSSLSAEQLAMSYEPSDFMFMGTRINRLSIGAVIRHLMVAEGHWISRLAECEHGDDIRFPGSPQQYDDLMGIAELESEYSRLHVTNLALIDQLNDEDMVKTVSFTGRKYSGMGFLWTVVSHHGFHMGQIDLLLRVFNLEPAEYMEWQTTDTLVA